MGTDFSRKRAEECNPSILTTPPPPRCCRRPPRRALTAMREEYGNPSSQYALGKQAAQALGRPPGGGGPGPGVPGGGGLFHLPGAPRGTTGPSPWPPTWGGTGGKHIITTAVEHAAVLEPCKALESQGYEVTYLTPGPDGRVRLADLEAALRPDTVLVSMMLVNERDRGRPAGGGGRPGPQSPPLRRPAPHRTPSRAFSSSPSPPRPWGVDLLTVSGHKIGAMKGSGALYIRSGLRAVPPDPGGRAGGGPALRHGAHPPDRRPGTPPAPWARPGWRSTGPISPI